MKEVMCMKDGPLTAGAPDPEVPEKATRRKFSAEYKLRILKLADNCTDSGSLGRLLRREGLYSSNLTTWRQQRDSGMLQGLEPAKRGRKAIERNPLRPELDKLRKENERLKRAELIIEVQKKVSQILPGELMEAVDTFGGDIGVKPSCEALGLSRATYYRTKASPNMEKESVPGIPDPVPRALSPEERKQVLDLMHSERFMDQAPRENCATLLDEGRYLCSVRTMYRILEQECELKERRNQLRHPVYEKPELPATTPNQA